MMRFDVMSNVMPRICVLHCFKIIIMVMIMMIVILIIIEIPIMGRIIIIVIIFIKNNSTIIDILV